VVGCKGDAGKEKKSAEGGHVTSHVTQDSASAPMTGPRLLPSGHPCVASL
jgi:hypothetical protein